MLISQGLVGGEGGEVEGVVVVGTEEGGIGGMVIIEGIGSLLGVVIDLFQVMLLVDLLAPIEIRLIGLLIVYLEH